MMNKNLLQNIVFVVGVIFLIVCVFIMFRGAFGPIKLEDVQKKGVIEDVDSKSSAHEKFEVVGVVSGTKNCVEHTGDAGGKLYVCIAPSGSVCKVEIGSDGSQHLFVESRNGYKQEITRNENGMLSKKKIQQDIFGIILNTPLVFEEECFQYIEKFPEEIQKAVLQTLLSLKT